MTIDVVVPTIGRPSLLELLGSLASARGPLPRSIILVDDRKSQPAALDLEGIDPILRSRVRVLRGKGAGPAAARNTGWRASDADWIAFLDDDVRVESDWTQRVVCDLERLPSRIAGSRGHVRVPLPKGRAPTDWERNVAGLQRSAWITADMAYRRSVLEALGGFDERFRRAYREDAEFALRAFEAGYLITHGMRAIQHPVRPADWWISVRLQAGNADDVLMHALHGPRWRERSNAPRGRFRLHAATVACAVASLTALGARSYPAAAALATAWLFLTGSFALSRILPGPHTAEEVRAMLLTSAAIPFAAVYYRLRATMTLPSLLEGGAR